VDADQSTGRLVSVPNSHIFTQPIYNYTRGFHYIWNEISVLVTFESNWRKAQKIILTAAQEGVDELQEQFRTQIRRMARRYMILYQHVTPIVYPRILDSGVQLTLRYLAEPKRRRGTEARLTAQILDAFAAEPDIEFAYPTTRFYDATREGKASAEPAPPDGTEGDG
jgi:small-conductance mechanosensitive channel